MTLFFIGFFCFSAIVLSVLKWPLQGIHSHRQADTLFAAYSYCNEGTEFLKPKIAHRNATSGVSIGEFPLFSYVLSLPCKVTGEWSESFPKIFSVLLALFCTLAWGSFLKKKYFQASENLLWIWAGVFFFIIGHLIHLTIPIPDAFASLIIAIAGLVDRPLWTRRTLSYFLFALGFIIRPYFFLLALLVYENLFVAIGALAVCGAPFLFWYKYWIRQSEIDYYATEVKTRAELIQEFPRAIKNIPNVLLRNHLNFVLAIPFFRGVMKKKKWALLFLISWCIVLVAKGDHYVNHSYYLGSASLFAAVLILAGILDLKRWQQNTLIGLSIVIGIANTQHLWLGTHGNHFFEVQEALEKNHVPANAQIAAYVEQSPQFLYWARKTGWLLMPDQVHEKCPSNVQFKLYLANDQVRMEPCP